MIVCLAELLNYICSESVKEICSGLSAVDIDERDEYGLTPLYLATTCGKVSIATTYLSHADFLTNHSHLRPFGTFYYGPSLSG